AFLVGSFISRLITKPIHDLHVGTEIIGKGNLDHKVGTPAQDEIGQLSRAFDKMTEDLKGTTTSIDALNKEVAERKKAEKKTSEAMELKSQFVSLVSHELRTPLTAIKEGIGIVSDGTTGKVNKDQKEFLEIAKRNVDRLARLINDILDFQKLQSGRMKFDIKENNINEVIEEVGKTMRSLAEEKGLKLSVKLDDKLPKIRFDKDEIIQVLTNLVNNAIKFTEKGGIAMMANQKEDLIRVSVQDTGCGIKKDDMPKLFRSFEQLQKDKQKKVVGTGLG
ncbi:unnamed protein product, partial [marine sediment metagenome]